MIKKSLGRLAGARYAVGVRVHLPFYVARPFTTTVRQRRTPAAAPSVRRLERERDRRTSQFPASGEEWPRSILQDAFKAGALPIDGTSSITLLEDFRRIAKSRKPSKEDLTKFCQQHNVWPVTLTMLGKVLVRTRQKTMMTLAMDLWKAAAELGDSAATMVLVNEGIKQGTLRHPDLRSALRSLQGLVEAKNPSALVVQARVFEHSKEWKKALQWYEEASTVAFESNAIEGTVAASATDALYGVARMKKELGDEMGSREAMLQSAVKGDNPQAYYESARMLGKSDPRYVQYLLKAASSGQPYAAYDLGRYYLGIGGSSSSLEADLSIDDNAQPQRKLDENKVTKDESLAREWFSIGAEVPGFQFAHVCQLLLALILRKQGQLQRGFEWLEKAASRPGSPSMATHAVPWLKDRWYEEKIDLLGDVNLWQVINGGPEEAIWRNPSDRRA